MHIGMLLYGAVCQILILVLFTIILHKSPGYASLSFWCGLALAYIGVGHMHRTLERALGKGGSAGAAIFGGYLLRYLVLILMAVIFVPTGAINVVILFAGYMGMKVSALSQPLVHKRCNAYFHETDPVPEPMSDDKI
jgi:hypothetical protein